MSNADGSVELMLGPENKLTRALRWALVGGASGVTAGIICYAAGELTPDHAYDIFVFTPGLPFGLVLGGMLWQRDLVSLPRIMMLVALSACAWSIVVSLNVKVFGLSFGNAWPGFVSGLVWSAVLTTGFAGLFSFARRPLLLGMLLAAGACSGSALVVGVRWSGITSDPLGFGIIWACWYAVYTAIFSTALPDRRELKTEVPG